MRRSRLNIRINSPSGFVVQAFASSEDALKEIDRCVNELNLRLLCLPTHYINSGSAMDKHCRPSPGPPLGTSRMSISSPSKFIPTTLPENDNALKGPVLAFSPRMDVCTNGRHVSYLYPCWIFLQKYPDTPGSALRTVTNLDRSIVGRRIQGFEGRPDLFEGTWTHPNTRTSKRANIFFDTLVHDVYAFRMLLDRQGINQIVAGIDDPYPLGEMETVPGSYPGKGD